MSFVFPNLLHLCKTHKYSLPADKHLETRQSLLEKEDVALHVKVETPTIGSKFKL